MLSETSKIELNDYQVVSSALYEHLYCGSQCKGELYISVQSRYEWYYDELAVEWWQRHPKYYPINTMPFEFIRAIEYQDHTLPNRPSATTVYIYKSSVLWWIESELLAAQYRSYFSYDANDHCWAYADIIARNRGYFEEWNLVRPETPNMAMRFVTIDDHMVDGVEEPPMARFWQVTVGGRKDVRNRIE